MTRISVCVPTYQRPAMLAQLIETFLAQEFPDRELCIADDSHDFETQDMVRKHYQYPSIQYVRNKENLGFARNLRTALEIASGDVLVVLGDDDLLASRSALGEYEAAFRKHPNAHFGYANIVQIDTKTRCTLVYPHFQRTRLFPAGGSAIVNLWLRSILITGMAFRRDPALAYYPQGDILFPQVELVGSLLLDHPGIGIGRYLCAARAHAEQLGFRAIKGEGIKGKEQHGVIEVMRAFESLVSKSPKLEDVRSLVEKQLARAYATNLPNEKIITGNVATTRNLLALVRRNQTARRSLQLWALYLATMLLPRGAVLAIKNRIRRAIRDRRLRRAGLGTVGLLETVSDAQTSAR